jgi:hypothetical protein
MKTSDFIEKLFADFSIKTGLLVGKCPCLRVKKSQNATEKYATTKKAAWNVNLFGLMKKY